MSALSKLNPFVRKKFYSEAVDGARNQRIGIKSEHFINLTRPDHFECEFLFHCVMNAICVNAADERQKVHAVSPMEEAFPVFSAMECLLADCPHSRAELITSSHSASISKGIDCASPPVVHG